MVNKIFNEDCLLTMSRMGDKSVDLVLTDPPYGIKRFENVGDETSGIFAQMGTFKNAESWNNPKPGKKTFDEIFRVSKNQIIWGGNNFSLPPSEYFIIWDKCQGFPNFAQCEFAWVSSGLKKPAKIFRYPISKLNRDYRQHPTQKPLDLFKWIIQNYSNENDIIYDPFIGSGTTAIACIDLKRNYIGSEISEEYYQITCERVRNLPPELF